MLRFPTAILCTGMVLLGALSGLVGLLLESTSQLGLEAKRLSYLAVPALPPPEERADTVLTPGASARPAHP